ncbi:SPX-domain-containing protein [Pseudovirgaria hyperparasitica]|uniref:Vacuolar transporter chaperone complex subunit 4 n=1 Tax=Pseudovirgaria hyperparasitica TaxID=470096 RepID=A0A6A6WDJ9_9PEZI|nr:SPX-domain-containing protein [Pseudovirgaria hyperparasitica]KAF2760134.1 SPX-domain-containing protein [Pseudovirgaria hyperparasitica]
MRFGQQLRSSLLKDWYYYYIAYDDLKAQLKTDFVTAPTKTNPKPNRKPWTEDNERRFVRELEQELGKVADFQEVKSREIVQRIKASEKEVNDVVSRAERQAADELRGSQVDAPTEEDFLLLEEDLSDIIADVHDLAKFVQLNYTGFQKIIKKHDKQTSWHLKPVFAARLKAKPFFKDNYDAFIVKLSKLYDLVRTRGNPVKGDSSAGGKQQNFVRQTTKYWVHPDNITEVKLILMKHLPVLVFNANKEWDPSDSAISSIYYDNTDTWELYMGRLKKTEGAEAIRLRWYGGMNEDNIFIERKTHREDWTGEKSVKARFKLKEKNVNDYLSGKLTVESIFEKDRREGKKSEKAIDEEEQLAREIQYRVITRRLVPVTRSFYHRTAFQLPGDARVRVSLDSELTMIREDNLDGKTRAGKNWRRPDAGIDFPFKKVPQEDLELFPYAVLEVKLQTQAGQEPPQWIRDLTACHLVEAVPKFSKFIHGTATLNPNRIHLIPFWMPQMDVDIRKPITHKFGIDRPGQSTDISTSGNMDPDSDDDDFEDEEPPVVEENEDLRRLRAARDALEQHDLEQRRDYGTASNGEVNGAAGNSLDVEERIAAAPNTANDYPLYDSDDEDEELANHELEEARRVGGLHYYQTIAKHHIVNLGSKLSSMGKKLSPHGSTMPVQTTQLGIPKYTGETKRFKAPPGKRIHVPVRIEPKVHLATERTFLAWLEFSIILASIAAALLNFGDGLALLSAWAFTLVAAAAMLYSLGLYLWRVRMTRKRRAVSYHDWFGPSVLCFGLLVSVAVSFGLRVGGGAGNKGGLKG